MDYWRTNKDGYRAIHKWVESQLGKPKLCDVCNDTSDRRYEWSNRSKDYKKDISDWQRLCVPCHRKMTRNAHKFCTNGHEKTANNIYIRPKTGYRDCKQCRQAYRDKYKGDR